MSTSVCESAAGDTSTVFPPAPICPARRRRDLATEVSASFLRCSNEWPAKDTAKLYTTSPPRRGVTCRHHERTWTSVRLCLCLMIRSMGENAVEVAVRYWWTGRLPRYLLTAGTRHVTVSCFIISRSQPPTAFHAGGFLSTVALGSSSRATGIFAPGLHLPNHHSPPTAPLPSQRMLQT